MHQGLVQRKGYKEWGDRIGFAYNWDKDTQKSKWGRSKLPITIDTSHEITMGLPDVITWEDELYWNLRKGARGNIKVLATTLDGKGDGKGDGNGDDGVAVL